MDMILKFRASQKWFIKRQTRYPTQTDQNHVWRQRWTASICLISAMISLFSSLHTLNLDTHHELIVKDPHRPKGSCTLIVKKKKIVSKTSFLWGSPIKLFCLLLESFISDMPLGRIHICLIILSLWATGLGLTVAQCPAHHIPLSARWSAFILISVMLPDRWPLATL